MRSSSIRRAGNPRSASAPTANRFDRARLDDARLDGARRLSLIVLATAALATTLNTVAQSTAPATIPTATPDPTATPEPDYRFDSAAIIPIEGAITEITQDSIERRFAQIEEDGTPLVILELDTPGGALGPTLEICKMIKERRDEGITVYSWINKDAFSAGTIIALATDGIVMARNATIGDCQPIMITGQGASAVPEEIEAKLTSPLLAELRDSARRDNYDLDMVLALIRPEMQIFWLEDTETGQRRFADTVTRNRLFGLDASGEPISATDEEDDENSKRRVPAEPIPDSKSTTNWRYVTQAPGLDSLRQPIVSDRELLTMRTIEAMAYGFAKAELEDREDLMAYFGIQQELSKLRTTTMESIVTWLASPTVRGVLFLLMLLGAYTEFQTPGLGVAGAVALVALVLFLGAPYVAGFTVTAEIVIILVGILLLGLELFVIPGFGLAGLLGMICLAYGLLASFVPAEPTFDPNWWRLPTMEQTYTYISHGLYALAAGLGGSLVGMYLLAKYLPSAPIARQIIAPNPVHDAIQIDDPYEGAARVGDFGTTESLLRPAGKARFGATLVDVVSQGEYIQEGLRVEVIERRGNRVVVRRVEG